MAIALVIVVVIFLYVYYRRAVHQGYEYASRKAAPIRSQVMPVPQRFKDILLKYFSFYQKLSAEDKVKFERKVTNFVYSKRFIPRNVDEVTIEAKVLIAACAVQLTFGLPNVYLQHFDKILVYPDDYYSSLTRKYHRGEVNPRFGIIVLSWQSFVDGYINGNDSKNVGLHEMAHALRLEIIIRNEEYNFFDEVLLDKFDDYSHKICNDMAAGEDSIFRPYACTNEQEFFAVAIESFFEQPEVFNKQVPELFGILVKLLNQNPLSLTLTT